MHPASLLRILIYLLVLLFAGIVPYVENAWKRARQNRIQRRTAAKQRYRESLLAEATAFAKKAQEQKGEAGRDERIRNLGLAVERYSEAGDRYNAARCRSLLAQEKGDSITAVAHIDTMLQHIPATASATAQGALLFLKSMHLKRCGWYRSATETAMQSLRIGLGANLKSLASCQTAQLLAAGNRFTDAEEYARQALETSETDTHRSEARQSVGAIRHYQGRVTEALEIYEKESAQFPTPQVFLMTAGVLRLMGRFEEAEQYIRMALQDAPTNPSIYHFILAHVCTAQEKYNEAIVEIDAAERNVGKIPRITLWLRILRLQIAARTHSESLETLQVCAAEVEDVLNTGIQAMPFYPDALRFYGYTIIELAVLHYDLDNPAKALDLLTLFDGSNIPLLVELPRLHYLRGLCYEKQNCDSEARAAYRQVLASDCEPIERHFAKASARLRALGDTGEG